MKINRTRIIAVAAVVGVAVTGAAGYAVATGAGPAGGSSYCAEMPDSVGLYAGNPVTQMGYEIGTVDDIEPAGDHVLVSFTLETDRAFPADVKAITRSKSLLADRSLELVGNYADGPALVEGECIALDHAYTPQSISQIAGSAADFIDAMTPANGPEDFERAIRGFDESLRGTGDTAQQMMNHASQAALSPDETIADIGSSIQNMAPLTEESLQRWGTLRSIFDQLPETLAAAATCGPDPRRLRSASAGLWPRCTTSSATTAPTSGRSRKDLSWT